MASLRTTSTTTIVTGTIAAARQLHTTHDAARRGEGGAVWEWPDILPREAWLRRSWEECVWGDPAGTPVLLTRWQELALWEEAIERTEGRREAGAERDILLNSHATARVAAQAWGLLQTWEAPLDAGAFEAGEDSSAFALWMKRVRKRLQEGGWITAAELPGALHRRAAFGIWKPEAPELFGFDEIAPAERRLFDAVGARVREIPAVTGEPRLAQCHDTEDELTRAAMWARQRLEARPECRIGIAMPSLAAVSGAVERVFDDILHPGFGFERGARAFEIAAGGWMAEAPMIATALLLLRLMDGVPREEAAPLWRSPFLAMDRGEGARLDRELRRARVDSVSVRTGFVQSRFADLGTFAATAGDTNSAAKREALPSQWSEFFARALSLAGWPGPRTLTRREAQAAEAWKDLLSEFARVDSVMEPVSRGQATARLQRMAEGTRLPAERSGAPVEILDIAETAGTVFDALWIGGLHAAAWPRPAQPNPFLPVAVQRAANMPGSSAEREFAQAQRAMARLMGSAAEVVCSYPAHAASGDKSEQQQASPLIREFSMLGDAPSGRGDTAAVRVFEHEGGWEPRPGEGDLRLPPGTEQRGGSRVIAHQSACPFRAFAVHRLNAKERDEPDVGLSALDRGSAAHRVMELLWAELGTSVRLAEMPREELDALIRRSVEAALAKFFAKHERTAALDAFRALEQDRLERLAAKWLEIEKRRAPFAVAYNEHERVVDVEGLSLKLRVDRIDRYENGTHAIVDYKTSKKLSAEMWQGERPEEPQLPLYAVTSDVDVSEVAFAQIATASQEWIGRKGAELEALKPGWTAAVFRLAADFLNGRADVDPREKPSPCDLCALHALCRIHEIKRLPRGHADAEERFDE